MSPADEAEMTHIPEAPAIEDAATVASSIAGSGENLFELQNGVVLELKPVPPIAIREAAIKHPPPKVPVVFIEDKGREEENPNDPAYMREVQRYVLEQLYRVTDVIMLLGTSIRHVPEGVQRPEDEEWVSMLEALAIDLPPFNNKYARYLSWLRLYAITSEIESGYILGRVTALSGVTEVEVQRAAAAFRDRSGR